jgi:class 3 adenylate cyclase
MIAKVELEPKVIRTAISKHRMRIPKPSAPINRPRGATSHALPRQGAVGQLTFLFTDLCDSAALYEQVGDITACRIVRQHFTFLAGVVHEHNGAVVKTIGDAVMAAFANPLDAVKAALAIQARSAKASPPLTIKLGVHAGDSIRVKFCNQVDYYGSAVNMAARLPAQSLDGDVVLSRFVAGHPAVRPLLASIATRADCATLKGFEGPVGFVRVLRGGPDPPKDPFRTPRRVGASVGAYQFCLALDGP